MALNMENLFTVLMNRISLLTTNTRRLHSLPACVEWYERSSGWRPISTQSESDQSQIKSRI